MVGLLGGKGSGLAEMTVAGLPVPPGFIITTAACQAYYAHDKLFPEGMWQQSLQALRHVEAQAGKSFGDPANPLLVSVRSGAPVSMPGMMDTVLNLGLNADTLRGLAELTGDERFAWDAYRRLVQMFGEIVLGVPSGRLAQALEAARNRAGVQSDAELEVDEIRRLVARLKEIILGHSRQEVPEDPEDQLRQAIAAVFDSWNNRRAQDYRRINGIPDDLGTAVSVQAMVFGNAGEDSGTGVAFTRNPTTGEHVLYGEFLTNAQGEDVVAGTRTPLEIRHMSERLPQVYQQVTDIARRLESHYRDMQDIEFTVERGTLWMLQTRTGKRTGRASLRIAVDLVEEGVISQEEAVARVTPDQLEQLLHPIVDPDAEFEVLASGLPASPGAAAGRVVFDADEAQRFSADGEQTILVRHETSPDDYHGMVAAEAIVTSRGGVTSHAAVVARGMGKCCVVGCEALQIDYGQRLFTADGTVVSRGDWITVNGNSGEVLLGRVPTIEPELDEYFDTLIGWADELRRLRVRANADTPADAEASRRLGAEGIGLCRTEHMFFEGDRIEAMREMIMAPNRVARAEALAKLEPLQARDFQGIFEAMDGYPVTIRLLDPPLHEFLPRHEETALRITDLKLQLRQATNLETIDALLQEINELAEILRQIDRLAEANPMLGHRGCRLGIFYPAITEMQARAIFTAAVNCQEKGITVIPEVMIPLVAFPDELTSQEEIVRRVAEEVFADHGVRVDYTVGTMIELPRACLTADELARSAEFFSFGTNDLTQTTLGLSRDDSNRFLPGYVERGFLEADPFQTLEVRGVGQLVRMGVERGRSTRSDLKVGICGEHGGDPASIAFCHEVGLDYVSCSTYRVPVARLAAAQAALQG
ncbi:MAG: pyruvate, phosphate dikinase [Actinomycetota bacterium]|nr:pyruvate, phosphate dikinase [Actinomycetota bacterium]